MHCASLLRTIFSSLARANERVYVQNEIYLKLSSIDIDGWIDSLFTLKTYSQELNCDKVAFSINEHGNLYFLICA